MHVFVHGLHGKTESIYLYKLIIYSYSSLKLAVLPMFVNTDIRKEMYKGADANVDAQFKKLYIYHMENVSILFADIKVSSIKNLNENNVHDT